MKGIYLPILALGLLLFGLDVRGQSQSIDSLVVNKAKRELKAYRQGKLVKTCKVALGLNPIGDKRHEGDNKTPEGRYFVNGKNPHSQYHKNLGISYPNAADRAEAKRLGKSAGGDVKIHGYPDGVDTSQGLPASWGDWTWGCVAITNEDIDMLYEAVPVGTVVQINP